MALAIVPPGNVLRDLAMIRGKLFTLNGLQGSRAWFDFPVLAWLGRSLDGGLLASLASSFRLSLEFGALRWEGKLLAMPVQAGFNDAILPGLSPFILEPPASVLGEDANSAPGSDKWCYGPFPAGKGMICAVLDETSPSCIPVGTGRVDILAEATRLAGEPPRANVYSIALVELHWYPGPNYGSSWAILSSVVAGRIRTSHRSIPVNGHTA
ncbi:MAG: hypothetical protein A3J97_12760 [Spirochaetes bacterium RIFOXYC1_FULL_54_7]|nr:MAG: hypothetical protein A3J97_12760 [Spirochaetes bacterium RIFOXYC1_FULL_54_7]